METVPIPWHSSVIDDGIIQQIETAIVEDRHLMERQLVHELNISVGPVTEIIHDHMHMGKVSA